MAFNRNGSLRWNALASVLALIAATLVGVSVSPGVAQADCDGPANPWTIYFVISGIQRGTERPQYDSTCDDSNEYRGQVNDTYTDGSCNYIRYYDPSQTTQGSGCSSSFTNFTFWDPQSDSWADWRPCTTSACTTGYYTNWGF